MLHYTSLGKQPISRCRSAGQTAIMARYGPIRVGRPNTPLTHFELQRAKDSPSPGEYGDPAGMSSKYMLARLGGKFGLEDLPSVFDVPRNVQELPGPGQYTWEKANGLAGGVKFSDANVPTDIDRRVKESAKTPSTFDYANRVGSDKIVYPRPDRNVTPFTTSLRPSFIDDAQRAKAYLPAPDAYQAPSNSRPSTSWAAGAKQKLIVRPATVGPRCSTVAGLWGDLINPPSMFDPAVSATSPEMVTATATTTGSRRQGSGSLRRSNTAPHKLRRNRTAQRRGNARNFTTTDGTQYHRGENALAGSSSSSSGTSRHSGAHHRPRGPGIKLARTTVDAVTNRSSTSIDKRVKLTSPLWKYEIPKQLRSRENLMKKQAKNNNVSGSGSGSRHRASSSRGRCRSRTGCSAGAKRPIHGNKKTTLENLWKPSKERPFLSLEDTMELAKMNLRAMDASVDRQQRKEELGRL
jgi:hypothetical protein